MPEITVKDTNYTGPGLAEPVFYEFYFPTIGLARHVRNQITDAIWQQNEGAPFLPKGIWCKACESFTSEAYIQDDLEKIETCPNCGADRDSILVVTLEDISAV